MVTVNGYIGESSLSMQQSDFCEVIVSVGRVSSLECQILVVTCVISDLLIDKHTYVQ